MLKALLRWIWDRAGCAAHAEHQREEALRVYFLRA